MPTYPKPNTNAAYRTTPQECRDRAQRALEIAEMGLDTAVDLMNAKGATTAELIAQVAARTRIAEGWTRLAEAKAPVERT